MFSGAGGLDLGFEKAGFNIIWANEYDKEIWQTYKSNFSNTKLDQRSILDIPLDEIPNTTGLIGGPPCQSWSEAGKLQGIQDDRGKLFFNFIKVLRDKQPLFFLAENVSGMLANRHSIALSKIKNMFIESGYNLTCELLNAYNYGVAQDRKRVFFVGYRKDLNKYFEFPKPIKKKKNLKDVIWDIKDSVVSSKDKNYTNDSECLFANHEYMNGSFSSIYMSRNRVRNWDEPSFTIQASGRHAPIHPQAPKMKFLEKDKREFVQGMENLYRRLSVRECARIQSFPDSHIFYYKKLSAGYKMVGNAVPPTLSYILAKKIRNDLNSFRQ